MMLLGLNMSMKYENCEIIKWYASPNSILGILLYSESYLCLPFLNVSCLWFWAGFQCDFWSRMEPKLVMCWYMEKETILSVKLIHDIWHLTMKINSAQYLNNNETNSMNKKFFDKSIKFKFCWYYDKLCSINVVLNFLLYINSCFFISQIVIHLTLIRMAAGISNLHINFTAIFKNKFISWSPRYVLTCKFYFSSLLHKFIYILTF